MIFIHRQEELVFNIPVSRNLTRFSSSSMDISLQLTENNETIDESLSAANTCHELSILFSNYIHSIIGILGCLLNLICVKILANKDFNTSDSSNGNVFKYLLIKSVCDALILLIKAVEPLFTCVDWTYRSNYLVNMLDLVMNKYFIFVCTLCSIVFELVAQLSRLVAISFLNTLDFIRLFTLKKVSFVLILFIAGFYVFKLYEYSIHVIALEGSSHYIIYMSEFSNTQLFRSLQLVHSFIRDFFCVVCVLLLDIIVLVTFRKAMARKKRLVFRLDQLGLNNKHIERIEFAEYNTTLMILTIGFMTLICRLPLFVNYLPVLNERLRPCFQLLTESLFLVNISSNILFFYFFNATFRTLFNRYVDALQRLVLKRFIRSDGASLSRLHLLSQNSKRTDHIQQQTSELL